ncbi:MAG: transcriptional regulator [Pyrobaculum sp.]
MAEGLILNYISRCPGPYFRQLSKELSVPVGTLDYYITKLWRGERIFRLGQRPRYFAREVTPEEAVAIYVLREGAAGVREFPEVKCGRRLCQLYRDLMVAALDKYPCLRRDVVDNFIALMSLL